jgi:hypothetical protein
MKEHSEGSSEHRPAHRNRSTYPLARDCFARASDGEAWAAAPDEYETPRVGFAIANWRS